ncbi:MAG: radical SAM protein [Patescibacteria group bacterium]|jgi:lysine 2,3-aminomutase
MDIKTVKTINDLERITGQKVKENDRKKIQEVLERYPAKFTSHLAKLMKKSKEVAQQFLPNILELEKCGTLAPYEEGLHAADIYGLERLYTDRVVITINFNCPSYCRFCFRKSRVLKNKPTMSYQDIDKAVNFIDKQKDIKGVLITGGDPLVQPDKLIYLIEKLEKIDHLILVRIGTRSFLYQPEKLTADLAKKLARFVKFNCQNPAKSKTLSIVTHFNHPDEITVESVRAFKKFTSQGIIFRNQTVLLKDINDDRETLRKLFETLVANNLVPYYLFHCMPLEGIKYLRPPVQKGIDLLKDLSKLSGLISPHYAVVTPIGKIRLIHSSKLKCKTKHQQRFVILKSPYKVKEFLHNTNQKKLPKNCYADKDDFIMVDYLDGE